MGEEDSVAHLHSDHMRAVSVPPPMLDSSAGTHGTRALAASQAPPTPSSGSGAPARTPGKLHETFRTLKRKLTRVSLTGDSNNSSSSHSSSSSSSNNDTGDGDDLFFQPPARPSYGPDLEDLLWLKYSTTATTAAAPATTADATCSPSAGDADGASSSGSHSSSSSAGGERVAWQYVPAVHLRFRDREQPSRRAWFTLLHCLDNREDLGTARRGWLALVCSALEVDVLAVEYTGYGLHRGMPSEPALCADVCAGYRYLTDVCRVPPARIVLCGKGLGSAPACFLAQRLAEPARALPVAEVAPASYAEYSAAPVAPPVAPRSLSGTTKTKHRAASAGSGADAGAGATVAASAASASAERRARSTSDTAAGGTSGTNGTIGTGAGTTGNTGSDNSGGCAGLILVAPRIRGTGNAKTSRFGDSLCDNAKRAPKIACPVLIVHPTEHLLVPVRAAKRFGALFKRLHRFVPVPGADLDTVLDMCDEYLDDVAAFLQSVSHSEYVLKGLRKPPAQIAESPAVAITAWFAVRGLREYAEQMLAFGFYDLAALKTAVDIDFEAVGIEDANTRALLLAAFAQAETLFEDHPNPFVCTGRTVDRGAVTWRVASFDAPTSGPDLVSIPTLSYSVETTRSKLILAAIAAYESWEHRKALNAAAPPPQQDEQKEEQEQKGQEEKQEEKQKEEKSPSKAASPVAQEPTTPTKDTKESTTTTTATTTPDTQMRVPKLSLPAGNEHAETTEAGVPRKSPRPFLSPRRISRTMTAAVLVPKNDSSTRDAKAAGDAPPRRHRTRESKRAERSNATPLITVRPAPQTPGAEGEPSPRDRKLTRTAVQRNSSVDVRNARPSTTGQSPRCSTGGTGGRDDSSRGSRGSRGAKDDSRAAGAGSSPGSSERGSLEAFIMTVLKKSSTRSSTVRGQAKLLFVEGVFTLADLDELLLDTSSDKWKRLSTTLDKRMVLACKSRAKILAAKPPSPSALDVSL